MSSPWTRRCRELDPSRCGGVEVLANPARADLDTLLARVASLSFIAAMEAGERARLLTEPGRAGRIGANGVDSAGRR